MSIAATNAEAVSNNWFLHPTGMRPNPAPSAVKRIPAGSCLHFPADRAAGKPAFHPAVAIPTAEAFPERPDSQPCAVFEGTPPLDFRQYYAFTGK